MGNLSTHILSIKDPENQIGELFFAGKKIMTFFGLFFGVLVYTAITFFFHTYLIAVISGALIASIVAGANILSTYHKESYFGQLIQHIKNALEEKELYLSEEEIKTFLSIKSYKVNDTKILKGHFEKGIFSIYVEEKIPVSKKPSLKARRKNSFTVEDIKENKS